MPQSLPRWGTQPRVTPVSSLGSASSFPAFLLPLTKRNSERVKKKRDPLYFFFYYNYFNFLEIHSLSGHRFPHSTPTGSTHQHSEYPSAQSQTALSRAGCPQCPPAQPPQSCPTRKVERGKSSSSVPEVTTVSIQELKRFFPAEKPIILHISRASKALCGKDWIIVG